MFGQNPSFGSRDRVQTSFVFWSKFDIQSAGVTLKMMSMSQKSNFFPCLSGVSVQVWSKSTNWFRRQSADKAHFYSLYSLVTLKITPKVTKI